MLKNIKQIFFLLLFILPLIGNSQPKTRQDTLNYLCKKWAIDSIEIIDIKKKLPPKSDIKDNYVDFRKNGIFQGQDFGVVINGKWKFGAKNEIINYEINNTLLNAEIIFIIIEITEYRFGITSKTMSGSQIIMWYKSDKNN